MFGDKAALKDEGRFEEYPALNIPADASFLEMLDIVNETLIEKGRRAHPASTTIAARASAELAA